MSTNNIFKTSVKYLLVALLFQFSTIAVKANEVSMGGFTGTLTTKLSTGLSMRMEANDCRLLQGDSLAISGTMEDRSAFTSHIGYAPDNGGGGCNVYETDTYGNTSTKAITRVNENQDDGKLNFGKNDVFDAGNSLAIGFTGSNADGVSINLSGIAYYNAALEFNTPEHKIFTNDQKDEFENQYKVGNAYITAPLGDNVDITIGNYVQSQGVTALLPIGVNVVNPVNLPLLRSPGVSLKDALLPQMMIGANAFLDSGVTLEVYYQIEQKETEIDVARSFYGSDFVGVNSADGLLNSPNYRQRTNLPYGGNYHNLAVCLSDTVAASSSGCGDSGLFAGVGASGTGSPTADTESLFYDFVKGLSDGSNSVTNYATLSVLNAGADYDTVIGAVAGQLLTAGGIDSSELVGAPGATAAGVTLTNTQITDSLDALYAQYNGIGNTGGLVAIRRAPDAEAKDSGQYGINLSGYLEEVGSGVEWGVYFNNSHSTSPRIRMLAIQNGYATTLLAGMGAVHTSVDFSDATATLYEQVLGGVGYGPLLCGAVLGARVPAYAAYGGFQGTAGTASYIHDPETCFAAFDSTLGGALHAGAQLQALGALSTLGFGIGSRYQIYYPEDIETFGASIATGIGPWATNFEVAYRPDFPLQVSVPQLVFNVFDSTGGTAVQSYATTAAGVASGDITVAALAAIEAGNSIATNKWSSQPNCDVSSATGKASATMSGYAECDGTAEFDVWTFDMNTARSFTASDPLVQNAGADGGSLLVEIGAVYLPDVNHNQGLVSTNHQSHGFDVYGNQCSDILGLPILSQQKNALFGNNYCEADAGPDDLAMTSRIRGSLNYYNFNNSPWSFSPSIGIDYDFLGNAPSSIGGWVEDEASITLGSTFTNGGTSVGINYVAELGDFEDNLNSDRDYVSASISHSF
jgi:hypothetical protein